VNIILCIHTYIHTYIQTYIQTYIHTYIHTYQHMYIRIYIDIHIRTCLNCKIDPNEHVRSSVTTKKNQDLHFLTHPPTPLHVLTNPGTLTKAFVEEHILSRVCIVASSEYRLLLPRPSAAQADTQRDRHTARDADAKKDPEGEKHRDTQKETHKDTQRDESGRHTF